MNYIDLFAGCGGLSLGLYNAGWKGLFAIEKSPDAFKTLKHNLIDKKNHFDWPDWLPEANLEIDSVIKDYKKELQSLRGKVDMVAGGPPCQGFSMAGRRKEDDQRNSLIKSYIYFISLVQPKIIFFENVKGFTLGFEKNKVKGEAYSKLVLQELGKNYYVKGQLINFGDYGVPQKRTRFILVGVRKDVANAKQETASSFFEKILANREAFLVSKNLTINTNLQDAISDLLKEYGTKQSPDTKSYEAGIYGNLQSNYQKLLKGDVKIAIADSHRFPKHRVDIVAKFKDIIESTSTKNKDISKELRERYNIKKHTVIPLDGTLKSPTITTLPDDYIHYSEPRILTVREYARIQSFPDWYEFQGKYTTGGKLRIKEVPRYTQIGNAIPPLFGEQSGLILKQLFS